MNRFMALVPLSVLVFSMLGSVVSGEESHAGKAVQESGRASGHASGSAAHSIAATGQLTSAASAVPLSVGGAILGATGAASTGVAGGSRQMAGQSPGAPLPISDETVTVIPPNEALHPKARR
ncbi:MAG: hypothetical protein H7837_07700 [Magnetococcus sp. MYC-9]